VGWGNAYAQIIWSKAGVPVELWPLRPQNRSQVIRDNSVAGKPKKYLYNKDGRDAGGIPAAGVLHVPGFVSMVWWLQQDTHSQTVDCDPAGNRANFPAASLPTMPAQAWRSNTQRNYPIKPSEH